MLDEPLKQAILQIAILSGVPLVISSVCGLLVGIFQAATQIQEQSISFLVRLSAVGVVLVLLAPWYEGQLVLLIQEMFGYLEYYGG
ncbi:MAG: EscS/YscS/HrcS family type III secretion system export apparatus protein [Proteobacteria bacterium]|nr:MAG: EscS/YscS/HrcS family type III secretion system export apparatus protein [Pseudomonadota bacterium]